MQSEGLLYFLFINFSYTQHQLRNGLKTTTTVRIRLSDRVKFIAKGNPKSKFIYISIFKMFCLLCQYNNLDIGKYIHNLLLPCW